MTGRNVGMDGRRGNAVALGLLLATVLGLGAAAILGKQNSDIEKEALRKTQEVAANKQAPKTAYAAEEAAEKDAKQLQYDEAGRVISIIAPGGGPIADLVELTNQADEASRYYAKLLYGDGVSEAQMAIAAQSVAAAKGRIGKVNANLAGNRQLIASLLRTGQKAKEYLGDPAHLADLRRRYPDKYGGIKDDDELRAKYLNTQWSGTIIRANRAYEYAREQLRFEGQEPSPAQINAAVSKLFEGSVDGDNEEAFKQAVADAAAIQDAYGTYQGTFTGQAAGSCRFVVKRAGVSASFNGAGRFGSIGSFTVRTSGSGPYAPDKGSFSGKMSGGLTWVSPDVPLSGTSPVTGSYQGTVSGSGLTGSWRATASGETRAGTFSARK